MHKQLATEESANTTEKTLSGHLLIVEDNTINQLVISHMVTNFGLTHVLANNGLEAVNLIKANNSTR